MTDKIKAIEDWDYVHLPRNVEEIMEMRKVQILYYRKYGKVLSSKKALDIIRENKSD